MTSKVVMSPSERACLDRMRVLLAAQGLTVTDEELVQVVLKAALRLERPLLEKLVRDGLAEVAQVKEKERRREGRK